MRSYEKYDKDCVAERKTKHLILLGFGWVKNKNRVKTTRVKYPICRNILTEKQQFRENFGFRITRFYTWAKLYHQNQTIQLRIQKSDEAWGTVKYSL